MPTVREPDGLAMSSRNAYLSAEERQQGLTLSRALAAAQASVAAGEKSAARLLAAAHAEIATAKDARVDYLELRDPDSLQLLETISGPTLFAMAVFFGKTRLIDNRVLRP
jgi:pantoate--beta-alanine ligase